MARIRTIKPDFFKSDDVSPLPMRARLTWIGLWTHCDDHGRYKDNTRLIKGDIWSLDDVTLRDIEDDLAVLADHGRIVRYVVDGKRYLAVVNWHAHQAINRPSKAKHPAPPIALAVANPEDPNHCAGGDCCTPGTGTLTGPAPAEQYASEPRGTVTAHAPLTDASLSTHARKGREGSGREGTRAPARDEPPTRCPRHLEDPDPPPCGGCKDARQAHERWERDHANHLAGLAAGPRCPHHRGQPAHNCGPCRADSLGGDT